jgi:hypothetical protein
MMSLKAPKGFENLEVRKRLAERLCSMIDAYDASMVDTYAEWEEVQQIYDDEKTVCSLEFLDDVRPYNFPLLQTRADALVDHLCDGITRADPYFVFKSTGVDEARREAAEKTVNYALKAAGFSRKIKDAALSAVLKTRGLMRVRYIEVEADNLHDAQDVLNLNLSEVQYSGLVIDGFRPEDSVVWPNYVEDIIHASLVGHRFPQRLGDIFARQQSGEYFDDIAIAPGDETGLAGSADNSNDDGKWCYDLIVKTRPEGAKRDLRYRVTLAKLDCAILAMEEYRLPKPWYFAPGMRYEPNRFWAKKSIGAKMIQTQTVMNDAVTLAVFGTAADAFRNVVTSGGVQETQQIRMGIGNLIHVKQPVNMQSVDARFNPGAIPLLLELCQRIADSIARISQAGLGQQFERGTTATAAAGYMQGQARGIGALSENFGEELVKMADFARYLLAIRFKSFKRYHSDAVPAQSGADLVAPYSIAVNGSAGTDPTSVVQKLELLIQAAQSLQVQLNPQAMFEAILNALELPVSTGKILMQQAGVEGPQGGQTNGQISPDQLLKFLALLRGQMASGAVADGTGEPAAAVLPGGPGGVPNGAMPAPGPGAPV